MKLCSFIPIVLLVAASAPAQTPVNGPRVALPFALVDTLDGVAFKIRVPANWNGTLLVYIQAYKTSSPPPEPRLVPLVVDSAKPSLEDALLSKGYALAASEIGTTNTQLKEAVHDTLALTSYFRGRVADPTRVIVWGSSLGGVASLKLVEEFPRAFTAAIPMCPPAAGMTRRWDIGLDYALAYAATFGWPEEWGPVGDLRTGLNFARDVLPKLKMPAADGSNRGGWEFIRLVNGVSSEAFWNICPLNKAPGLLMSMLATTQQRGEDEGWSAGPVAQNLDHRYTLRAEDKAYLATLGVNADDLLAKMNAQTSIAASPIARDFLHRFGDLRGLLLRPSLTLHNTADGAAWISHESAYRAQVETWGCSENLVQVFVAGVGHCAFTSRQVLAAVSAVEQWLDTGVKPDPSFFPEGDGFDNRFEPPQWPFTRWPF